MLTRHDEGVGCVGRSRMRVKCKLKIRTNARRSTSPRDGVALVIEPRGFAIAEFTLEDGDETGGALLGVDETAAFGHIRAHPTGVKQSEVYVLLGEIYGHGFVAIVERRF